MANTPFRKGNRVEHVASGVPGTVTGAYGGGELLTVHLDGWPCPSLVWAHQVRPLAPVAADEPHVVAADGAGG